MSVLDGLTPRNAGTTEVEAAIEFDAAASVVSPERCPITCDQYCVQTSYSRF